MNSHLKLKVMDVEICYGSYKALSRVEFEVSPGEFIALLGPNGAGKTTLLKTIARILKPRKGVIYLNGKNIMEMNDREYAKITGYLPQINDMSTPMRVFEVVSMGRKPYVTWQLTKEDINKIWSAMKTTEVDYLAFRSISEVSGGERQRVMIARILAQEPKVLLLDEPVTHLDLKYQRDILKLIRKVTRERKLITITSLHDINLAFRFADKVILMKKGLIYAIGKPEEVLVPENIREVFEVNAILANNPRPFIVIEDDTEGD